MEKQKIIFASRNRGKAKEVNAILGAEKYEVLTLHDFPDIPEIEETGTTFYENAVIKAKAVYELLRTPVIADDSGLCVDQLGGAPGVYSARFAGKDAGDKTNTQKLLKELTGKPVPHPAKFVCCAVYYDGNRLISADGEIHGEIIPTPRGTGGFGFDPVFLPTGRTETMAELAPEEKNSISHRFRAFDRLKKLLESTEHQ